MNDADSADVPPPRSAERCLRPRILVVDDDPDSVEVVTELLTLAGHQTRFAFDGPSALAVAKAFQPQLVFLDIGLPGMDGYEVARQLRLEPALASVVLVALTGWSGSAREFKAREAGFDHYVVKPLEPTALKVLLGGWARVAL